MDWLGLAAILALGGAGIWIFRQVFKPSGSPKGPPAPSAEPLQMAPTPLPPSRVLPWEGDGDFETQVEGESLYQDALLSIVGEKTEESQEFETRAILAPELFNGNRLYAVMIAGKKVGYLESPMTLVLNEMVARNNMGVVAFEVEAMITGGWKRAGSEGMFGVVLDLIDEDDAEDD
jgi:hypothetical protein